MKYDKTIQRINSGQMTRAEMNQLKTNAQAKLQAGDTDAAHVLEALKTAAPPDEFILFMGFCPGADFNERLDLEWKEKGICRFDYRESERQAEQFDSIRAGDLVVLKKREQFGKTMRLYGHGRVKSVQNDDDGTPFLVMDWSSQEEIIEVPLMACNSTVDVKRMETVKEHMPEEFYHWLNG